MVKSVRSALGVVAAAAVVAACGGGDDTSASSATKSSGEPVTIEWWHIQNNDPMKTIWADAAKQYMADHPNVKIKITVLENEAFKSKLTTTMQGGKLPDMFQSWGGGTLKEQADAGLVQDVSEATKPWIGDLNPAAAGLYQIDGKQYGIPFNLGMVGVWYRKSLFEKAGIDGAAGDLGGVPGRRRQAQGRRHHAAGGRREGQVARDVLVGEPVAADRRQGRDGQGRRGRLVRLARVRARPARSSRS